MSVAFDFNGMHFDEELRVFAPSRESKSRGHAKTRRGGPLPGHTQVRSSSPQRDQGAGRYHPGEDRDRCPVGASPTEARVSPNRTRGSLKRTFSMLLAHEVTKDRFASSSLVAVGRQTKRRMVSLASALLDPYGRPYPLIPVPHRMYPRFYLQSETNRIFLRFL